MNKNDLKTRIETSNISDESKAILLIMIATGRSADLVLKLTKRHFMYSPWIDHFEIRGEFMCICLPQTLIMPFLDGKELDDKVFSVSVDQIKDSMDYLQITPEMMIKSTARRLYANALEEFKKNDPKMLKGLPDDFFNGYALKYLSSLMRVSLEEYRELLG